MIVLKQDKDVNYLFLVSRQGVPRVLIDIDDLHNIVASYIFDLV
jgi:hypothetical protein